MPDEPIARPIAIVNARVYTCSPLGTLERGTVVVQGSKIAAVGADVAVPEGAGRVDAGGASLTPGFVDPHTHLGIAWQELAGEPDTLESTQPFGAHLRVLDSVDPKDVAFDDACYNGVTTVAIHPGDVPLGGGWGGVGAIAPIAGQSLVMKTHGRDTGSGLRRREVLRDPAGLKLGFGEAAKRSG